jgi:Glycosyl hydrolases family 43
MSVTPGGRPHSRRRSILAAALTVAASAVAASALVAVGAPAAHADATTQRFEAESLLPAVEATAPVQAQDNCCGVTWAGNKQLWFRAQRPGDRVTLAVPVDQAGEYDLSAVLTRAPDYGVVRFAVDGVTVGQLFDGYHAGSVVVTGTVQLGAAALTAGTHRLTVTVPTRNPASTGYFAGVDTVTLTRRGDPPTSVSTAAYETVAETPSVGARVTLYDTGDGWYFNDHTVVRDEATGKWHLFGISHAMPADPEHERTFGHLVSDSLVPTGTSTWSKLPDALTAAADETYIWAPHVIRVGDLYYMFYAAGTGDPTAQQIRYATSPDLSTWTRRGTILTDGWAARDPMVTRVGDEWVMYYTATTTPSGGNHIVAYKTSTDLVTWSARRTALDHPATGAVGGPTESPFVVQRGDWWYLFVCCDGSYDGTRVYRSRDPLHFEYGALTGTIRAHAAEVVVDLDGRWYATHAGWGERGVYLAPLTWTSGVVSRGTVTTTPYYRAEIQQWPRMRVSSLGVDPAGQSAYRSVLDASWRTTAPYLAVGQWGPTDPAGAAPRGEVSADGTRLALPDIPMGDEPATADLVFTFTDTLLQVDLSLNVAAPLHQPIWEVAFNLDTALPYVGDPGGEDRNGDVAGFPGWTMATADGVSLVCAYRPGSAWRSDNHWFYPAQGMVAWQPLWAPNGTTSLTNGAHHAGTWLLGASGTRHDTTYANWLAALAAG